MEEPLKKIKPIDLVSDIAKKLSLFLEEDAATTFFVSKVADVFKAGRISFMILDSVKQELSLQASQGIKLPKEAFRIKVGQMFGGWVAKEGIPLLVKDVEEEYPDISKDRLSRYKSRSFIIVPIKLRQEIIGILSVTDKKDAQAFDEEDLKFINLLCQYFALHIDNIRLAKENSRLITFDVLTELYTHRYFQEHLLEAIYNAERYKQPLTLLALDIDDFSKYNQDYGFSAGDSALKQIGKVINENRRRSDVAARYGPEEFMMFLPNTRLKQAITAAERIRERIRHSVFTEDRSSSFTMARLTVSVGIAEHKVGLDKERFIQQVIDALKQAKQQGKNRICVFK